MARTFTKTMRRSTLAALSLIAAASLVSATPASAATANHGRGQHHARFAQLYIFKGTVAVAPVAGATTLQISVTGGDRPALRALVGNTVSPLSFTVDSRTSYIAWTASERGNGPSATTEDALKVGDPVHLRILSNRRAPLAQLLATPVRMVNDFAAAQSTTGRLFLFQGRAVGVDTTAKTITIDVQRGNWFALNAMLGQPTLETFHYDSATLFISWHRRTPHSFDPSAIKVGDPIMLKTRGVWNTPLATLLAAPLWKVNDHAPASTANSSGGNMPLES
jgi:hypothetical protein